MRRPGNFRLRALTLGAFLILTAAQVAAATGDLPDLGQNVSVGHLPAGGTVIVRPAEGAPVAAVELWYIAPSSGFAAKPQPSLARLAAQVVAGSKPIVGESLGTIVRAAGGRLAITAYSDCVAISAVVPATSARQVVHAMTTAFFAPVTSEDGFRSAQRDVGQEALVAAFDPQSVVRDAVFGSLFASGPQRLPALGAPKDVAALTFAEVKSFATRAFRSSNATLVVAGAVDASVETAAAVGRPPLGDAGPEARLPALPASEAAPVAKDFAQPSGGYGWIGPAIADQREATAMDFIADYLFRPADGVVTKLVAERFPDAFVVGQFITLNNPGVMFVAYTGKDADGVKTLVDGGVETIRKPLAGSAFAAALESFKYHVFSDLQTPTQLADNFGWYSVEGSPAYAPGVSGERGAYFKAAGTLTPEFVAKVAEKYLGKPPVAVTLRPQPKKTTAQ